MARGSLANDMSVEIVGGGLYCCLIDPTKRNQSNQIGYKGAKSAHKANDVVSAKRIGFLRL